METIMANSHPPRKRPQSDIKPSPDCTPERRHNRRRSTGTSDHSTNANRLAEFDFFGDKNTGEISTVKVPSPESPIAIASPYLDAHSEHKSIVNTLVTPPTPRLPEVVDISKSSLDKLTHPSGSPVLARKFTPEAKWPVDIGGIDNVAPVSEPFDELETDVKPSGGDKEREQRTAAPAGRCESASSMHEHGTASAMQVYGEEGLKAKMVDIHLGYHISGSSPRKESFERHDNREGALKDAGQDDKTEVNQSEVSRRPRDSQEFCIKRKSLPRAAEPALVSPTARLRTTRSWLDDSADEESDTWSIESVINFNQRSRGSTSNVRNSKRQSQPKATSVNFPVSSSKNQPSQPTRKKPSRSAKGTYLQPLPDEAPEFVRPATPTARPASPPLHRNVADTRNSLEGQDGGESTLYSISCRTSTSYLKSLLRGPVFEFRSEPQGEPFLTNVSQRMLQHFIGSEHLDRLIRDYGLPAQDNERGDGNVLVFPPSLIGSAAVMRIVRYMRRCCARTATIMKPHFQLHAPPSLEASIETIRACNIFGLYADSRRIQHFLIDKKIPGGQITMDDVETLWEGYDGDLRDTIYTDALLTHIIFNVLGSDSVDREDFLILLEQEEYAGLRELVSTELGIKKRANEGMEVFKMRKKLEREERENRAVGKGKRLSKLEKLRERTGPMVQGRLLRILSYDALFEADPTAVTRYKRRTDLYRKSTPDLLGTVRESDRALGEKLNRKSITSYREPDTKVAGEKTLSGGLSDANDEVHRPSKMQVVSSSSTSRAYAQHRPSAPTPSGRRKEVGASKASSRPSVPPKSHTPNARAPDGDKALARLKASANEAFAMRESASDKPAHPATVFDGKSLPPANWREFDAERDSKLYSADGKFERFFCEPQNPILDYGIEKDGRLMVPRQQHQPKANLERILAVPGAGFERRPQLPVRADSLPVHTLANNVEGSVGRKQPGVTMYQSQFNPRERPMVRTRTASYPTHTKPSKLKRIWDEVKDFYNP